MSSAPRVEPPDSQEVFKARADRLGVAHNAPMSAAHEAGAREQIDMAVVPAMSAELDNLLTRALNTAGEDTDVERAA